MNNEFIKAALIRALHTFWQTLASLLPVGVVITPTMLKDLDWSVMYVVLAWLATALLASVISFVKSMAVGMPEVVDSIEPIQDTFNDENIFDMMECEKDEDTTDTTEE